MPRIAADTLEQHRADTVDRLLDAFGTLVMERGFSAVSLADVASQVHLARTAIYNYFPDRGSMLVAWTNREVQRMLAVLEREVSQASSSAEKLETFVRLELESFTSKHLPPGREATQFLGPETYRELMEHLEPIERILREILDEGTASGELPNADADGTVPLVMGCIGAKRVPLATGAESVKDATEQVTAFLLRALGPTASKPRVRSRKPSRV